jgi:hypothetical protein
MIPRQPPNVMIDLALDRAGPHCRPDLEVLARIAHHCLAVITAPAPSLAVRFGSHLRFLPFHLRAMLVPFRLFPLSGCRHSGYAYYLLDLEGQRFERDLSKRIQPNTDR